MSAISNVQCTAALFTQPLRTLVKILNGRCPRLLMKVVLDLPRCSSRLPDTVYDFSNCNLVSKQLLFDYWPL